MASKNPPRESELQARLETVAKERDQLADLLRERERDRRDFFATLAHELRNPLAAMRSAVHVLAVADNDHALARAARGMIERQVTQLTRLIDDLADVTQIAEGQLELRRERVNLESLLHRAIDNNRSVLESRQQHLRLELPPSTVWLHVDSRRIVQVFAGILNNSSKFSDLGTEIRIRAEQEEQWLTVSISDQGAGISDDLLPQVFDMFRRSSHGVRDVHMGLGIGMTLAKSLVELHGGRIAVHSEGPGRGSTFEVQLNLQVPVLRGPPAITEAIALSPERSSARVLIVDDNRDGAQGLALMLDLEGHDVRTAADGLEALEIAEEFRPNVVLLDIGMPGIDGYETARRLRARPWGGSVLLCAQTGWGQEDDKRRSRSAGFDRHLVKPIDPEELNRILAEVCHHTQRPVRPDA